MKQKKPGKAILRAAGCFVVVMLGIMAVSATMMFLFFAQERKKQASAEQAEEQKEQERRGSAADHMELTESLIPEEPEGFKLRYVTYYSYDDQGRCTAMEKYEPEGKLVYGNYHTYDGQGNLILEQSEIAYMGKPDYEESRYTYDGENRLTLEQSYDNDVLICEYYYRYAADGSVYRILQYYDNKGQKEGWLADVLNENGDPVSEYHYNEEDQVQSCKLYRYDEEGRQIYYICYNKGDETTRPLREVFTEYGENQSVRISYEPLGHLNSAHYVTTDENSKTEMYYLAGYSGGSGGDDIRILGQEEPKWNRELKFWEGNWRTYDGENMLSRLHCSYDTIYTYAAYWYEEGNKIRELWYDRGFTKMLRYVYNADDTLAKCYEYELRLEKSEAELPDGVPVYLEEELQDGTRIRLEYKDNVTLQRLLCTNAEGTVLREITFETEAGNRGRIDEWYEPLKEQLWAEALIPTEDGIAPADRTTEAGKEEGENQTGQMAGEEQEGSLGQGDSGEDAEEDREEFGDEISFPCYYVVQRGDSLWTIAERIYGDPYQFVIIYRANKTAIGPDWNFVPTGMLLLLPEPDL